MKKIILAVIFSMILINNLFSQSILSAELNGGVIIPFKSYGGLQGNVQINYSCFADNYLYASFSYSSWDRNKIVIYDPSGQTFNDVYSEYDHTLYSIFAGNRFIFFKYKTFSVFNDIELGYQNLNYMRIFPQRIINPDSTVEYLADYSKQKSITESLLGLGVGFGLKNDITEKVDLIISVKINSYINRSFHGLFGSANTNAVVAGGFVYNF